MRANSALMRSLLEVPSQTTPEERLGLYELAKEHYTGEGLILDIGTAAGGSTLCLGLGLADNQSVGESRKAGLIHGFDLFDGYSIRNFRNNKYLVERVRKRGRPFTSDIELFDDITSPVMGYVRRHQIDIVADFETHTQRPIEIAHIDAAKTLPLWSAICNGVCRAAIPGLTTLVFQDFERCRLPWQWLFIGEVLQKQICSISKVFRGGTVHLVVDSVIPMEIYDRASRFKYTVSEARTLWALVKEVIDSDEEFMNAFGGQFEDIAYCTLTYIQHILGEETGATEAAHKVSRLFLDNNSVYRDELGRYL